MLRTVAIYYRVSTDKQDFESQKYAIDQWLKENPAKEVIIFQDFARSGADPHRPQLKKLLKLAKKKAIDTVVTYRLDRLSRRAVEGLQIVLNLDYLGVDIVFVKQPYLTTKDNPFRRVMIAIFAEISEQERAIFIERVKDGIAAARARGVKFGAPVKLTDEKIAMIKKLRSQYKSLREIARQVGVSIGSVHKALQEADSAKKA